MIVFDGNQRANERALVLQTQVATLKEQRTVLKIAAILFAEDLASKLYTRLKSEAAERVGIAYEVYEFSLRGGTDEVVERLELLNADPTVTGIIIQKPYRRLWAITKGIDITQGVKAVRQAYASWWRFLTSRIAVDKDVDGLHPDGKLLPATAKAVLEILKEAKLQSDHKVVVLGRSDIVGLPVYEELKNQGYQVQLLTRDELEQRQTLGRHLLDFDVVISATGHHHLITGEMVKDGTIVIDVGEPSPDVEFETVSPKVTFITPVPGGVGPMTVECLLENCVALAHQS